MSDQWLVGFEVEELVDDALATIEKGRLRVSRKPRRSRQAHGDGDDEPSLTSSTHSRRTFPTQ